MTNGFEYFGELCPECGYYMDPNGECLECAALLENNSDIIGKPEHYSFYAIEPIEYIMRNEMEFWRGNIVKYASRAGYKQYDGLTMNESEITDLKKIKQYVDFRLKELEDLPF